VPIAPKPAEQRLGHRRDVSKRATSTTVTGAGVAKPPSPPSWLAKRLHPEYRRLWRESAVAELWSLEAVDLVSELVDLRDRIRRSDDVRASLLAERRQLERELLLTPRAQRQSGVTVDAATRPPATLHSLEGGGGLTAAQRRDLQRDRRRARVAGVDAWETP
jgi:hypothetical protein